MTTGKRIQKVPILGLPLVAPSSRFTTTLLADPLTPHPASLLSVPESSPSLLRRSRGVSEGAHFTYISPLVVEFPYDFKDEEEQERQKTEENEKEDGGGASKNVEGMTPEERQEHGMRQAREGMERVERLMRPFEVDPQMANDKQSSIQNDRLTGFLPKARMRQEYPSARILGLSESVIKDCVPQLDVGDAFTWIKEHNGKDGPECYTSGPMSKAPAAQDESASARYQLSDYLSGRLVGATFPSVAAGKVEVEEGAELGVAEAKHQRMVRQGENSNEESAVDRWHRRRKELSKRQEQKVSENGIWSGYAPWANAYSGHQFGVWAGQLGDGRAVTLMETVNVETGERWELQLKGAGRTPYSRFADGLATLGSSVREYLASEALSGLGIPTSRALAVISLPDLPVLRERRNAAAICTRLAPIWTRVGSFEHHANRKEWESIRLLADFVAREGYKWDLSQKKAYVRELLLECARRNAKMIAHWQIYGFMHGVINTDNISMLGITIDYGPYAFMDIFDQNQICNKSDGEGRYTYKMQPTNGLYAMEKLLESLAPLIGFELEKGRAPGPGELVQSSEEQLAQWTKQAKQDVEEELKTQYMGVTVDVWKAGWRQRMGLRKEKEDDREVIFDPLLDLLEDLDFGSTLRKLCDLPLFIEEKGRKSIEEDDVLDAFISDWIDFSIVPEFARDIKREYARRFLHTYVTRLEHDGRLDDLALLHKEMKAKNPSFVLRNWVTEEVVKRLEEKDDTEFLQKVLDLCVNPFTESNTDDEVKRLCSIGTPLTGNMPSCSS